MTRRDDEFARIYWRTRLRLAGCMAFVGVVLVLAALS
jgi:hypothetical protein